MVFGTKRIAVLYLMSGGRQIILMKTLFFGVMENLILKTLYIMPNLNGLVLTVVE